MGQSVRDPHLATVSLTALAPFIRLLEESGTAVVQCAADLGVAVLERWGVAVADVEADITTRVPHAAVVELFEVFMSAMRDPTAPIRAGTKLRRGDYHLLEYLCGSCENLERSLDCLAHYYPLLVDAELTLSSGPERVELRYRLAPGLASPAGMNEFSLSSILAMGILHIELEGALLPIEVTFRHPAPLHHDTFQQVFGVPARFAAEHDAIVFHPSMLQQRLRTADPVLHGMLRGWADQELSQLRARSALPFKVGVAIEAELPQGALLDRVAAHLHMTPGSLRSRLRQHGTTYSELVDGVRKERAKRALRDARSNIADLAQELGFAHTTAFHRAFRRWFGVTASAYREVIHEHPASRFWRSRK
jgi:AraC-like DNA-binding protein